MQFETETREETLARVRRTALAVGRRAHRTIATRGTAGVRSIDERAKLDIITAMHFATKAMALAGDLRRAELEASA